MARRYDIDWIRVIAIGLLLVYHTAIGFQPWGFFIGFITNNEFLQSLWTPMTMLNIWRIPILFYVSGMGLFLAIQNRNWKQLFVERFKRIGIPFLFGSLVIVPIHQFIIQNHYGSALSYKASMGHLWFLGNILVYVILLAPVFYFLKNRSDNDAVVFIKRLFSNPIGLAFILILFIAEAVIVKPPIFEMYAYTSHGFFLGLVAFLSGYLFMLSGTPFWKMIVKWRFVFLIIALTLFAVRCWQQDPQPNYYLLVVESNVWIFSLFAFANKHLNKNNKNLTYLKEAAYPVYILHMIFLYLGSTFIFSLNLIVEAKYILLLLFTILGSLSFYEFIIKRFNPIRQLFGLNKI
jgi:hypothetical protein